MDKPGGGFDYTFGDSRAAVNLMGGILQKPEYQRLRRVICRRLAKQIEGMKSLMAIKDERYREATLRMWHGRFPILIADFPEIIRTHIRCVETGVFRQLLRDNKEAKEGLETRVS